MNRKSIIVIVAGVLLIAPSAFGQLGDTSDGAKASWRNASGGAVEARSPGRMVQQGILRYEARHGFDIAHNINGPTITETEEDESIFESTRADTINILFQNLNALIVALGVALQSGTLDGGTGSPTGTPGTPATTPDLSDLLGGQINGPAG